MPVPEPTAKIIYEGVDITADLLPSLLDLSITDELEFSSDSLTITLDNLDGRWSESWLPTEGDVVRVSLGYNGQPFPPMLSFQVDECQYRYGPDTFTLKALSTPITKSLREDSSKAYENTTLRAIAQQIADKHELELVGDIPAISFKRETQKNEPDLVFLKNLAKAYGLIFKISNLTQLVFFREVALEEQEAIATFEKAEFFPGSMLKRSFAGTYRAAEVRYQDAAKGEFITIQIDLDGETIPKPKEGEEGLIKAEDILRIDERVESLSVARTRAAEGLRRANRDRVTLSGTLPGDMALAAGVTVLVNGFGRLGGKFLVTQSTQRQGRGFTTKIDGRKVIEE